MRKPAGAAAALAALLQLAGTADPGDPSARADAAALLASAEDLLAVSAGRLAVDRARAARAAALGEGDAESEVAALSLLAAALESRGERASADAAYREAEARAEALGTPAAKAVVLLSRATGHWQRADYPRALAAGERALALAEEAGERALAVRALLLLGRCDLKRGDYDGAVARFARAQALAELAGERRLEAWVEEHLAVVELDRRRYASSLKHWSAALAIHEQLGGAAGRARVLEKVSVLHLFQGDGEGALAAAESSLAVAGGPGGDPASAALALQARAGALRSLGRLEEARGDFERALALRREVGDPRETAWLLARLGRLEADLARPAAALARFRTALELWTALEQWRPVAWYLIEAARAHERLGADVQAREHYRAAIELAERIELPYRSVALGGLARLEARAGERAAALLDGRRAVEAAHATGNPAMIWAALYDLAEVELAFDLRSEALDHLRAALAALEAMRAESVPSDRAKRAEVEERQVVFRRAIGLLFDLGLHAEALEVAERARARASLDLFASAGAREAPEIAAELERVAAGGTPSPRSARVPATPLLVGEVRRRGVTAVEYFVGDDRLFAWVIGADGALHATSTPIAPGEIESRVRAARGEAGRAQALAALHRLLIDPVAPWLPRDAAQTLVVVPHDRLFLLPFAALRDGGGRYLIERHALAYSPSLALLAWTGRARNGARADGASLVVGNPRMPRLPGAAAPLAPLAEAEAEARAVAAAIGGPTEVLIGAAADEDSVRERAASAPLVHLATHGVLDDADPLRSLVALAPGERPESGDGRWTVAEIQESRLASELVTLSACETGLGPVSADGVFGLSRAFLVAGARSVLVSLWRVADIPTRFQMERFYRALDGNGGDRAAALRDAQLATLAALRRGALRAPSGRPLPDSPAHWAPFVLLGEPR
jgi:CHAT domain-containing protein/tetratricopeptide (TPR) repeat protein